MKIKEKGILEDVMITYSKTRKKYYSNAKLNIDNYFVEIPSKYFDTIDEAMLSIKERIVEAVKKFKPSN